MKKILLIILAFIAITVNAQSPEGFKYQALIRDASGSVLSSQAVGLRVTIIQTTPSGTEVYQETFSVTTSQYGLVDVIVGQGTVVSGVFSTIDWGADDYFIKTEMNPGSGYITMGTSQLLSVPYAMYSSKAGYAPQDTVEINAGAGIDVVGTFPSFTVTNTDTLPEMPTGATDNTIYYDGSGWASSSFLLNDGAHLGVNGLNSSYKLYVNSPAGNGNLASFYRNIDDYININDTTNDYFLYVNRRERISQGDGQASIYGYRTRDAQNDGTAYSTSSSNSAIKGYNLWGDMYSFGVNGFNWNDNTRCGGVLGANYSGAYWGILGYKNSGSSTYGVYGSAGYSSGTGKSSSDLALGIGVGAWGSLFGADIHGQVYGSFIEGERYALYTNGIRVINNLDVHLQENGSANKSVGDLVPLYTNVSTDVSIQSSGIAQLSNGSVFVPFDQAFAASVSAQIPVVVTVSAMGTPETVYVESVTASGFTIRSTNATSSVQVSFIAIGRRAGYENPQIPSEITDHNYLIKINNGLTNDGDTQHNAQGLYWENGELHNGVHPSTIVNPAEKPAE